jgi:hypothetical protein
MMVSYDDVLAVPCPVCGAAKGTICHSAAGKGCVPHAERRYRANAIRQWDRRAAGHAADGGDGAAVRQG